jgi:hypothetical protein
VSVSHNTVRQAALKQSGVYDTWAIGIGHGGALLAEAPTPGYVQTMVFANKLMNVPAPWSFPPWVFPNGPGHALAIANGVRSPNLPYTASNYPLTSLLCDNQSDYPIGDYPYPPEASSTLIHCP